MATNARSARSGLALRETYQVGRFLAALKGKLRFDEPDLAFCTHFSWFGVVNRDRLGIEELHLFYNRVSRLLSPNLLTFRIERADGCRAERGPGAREARSASERQRKRIDLPLSIEEDDSRGFRGRMAFLDSDILCYHASLEDTRSARVIATLLLPETNPRFERRAEFNTESGLLTVKTLMPATDHRDPDPSHALTLCLIVPPAFREIRAIACGTEAPGLDCGAAVETDGPLVITFAASAEDMAGEEQAFILGIGEGPSADKIESRMPVARVIDSAVSAAASLEWLTAALDAFTFEGIPRGLRTHYARAAYQMLSNTKSPRGQIGRFACFPSRGRYCAHYLWDSCFNNLGVSQFNERLAEGFLVALCENQEPDGKIPHFVCATWNRPGESQPPLIAWSAWRLYEQFGNKELIRDLYEPLCRYVEWWFAERDVDGDGLAEYNHALESGWDNSPRFDKGRIAAIDLNSYLNREMRILARMAPVLARDSEAADWERRAHEHARLILGRLFDREDGIFYDRLVLEDRLHKVLTPASFMPLWTGVRVSQEIADRMIARYLVNPKHFFGSRPFPVVAYSDPNYKPDDWWRGPVWPNIAWAMTEILHIHGFEREHREAVRKLLEMMDRHDELNELYNSATGEPLGAPGMCWGDAIFMDLARQAGG